MSWQTQQTKKELVAKSHSKKLGLPKYDEGKKVRGGGNNYANMVNDVEHSTSRNVSTLDK